MRSFPNPVVNIVFSGSMPGGERFAWGLWADCDIPLTQADANTTAAAVQAAFASNNTNLLSLASTNTAYNLVTLTWFNASGLAIKKATQTLGGVVGTGTVVHQTQSALVVTLITDIAAASYRGRIYLPADGAVLTLGQRTAAQTTATATSIAALLTAINTALPGAGAQLGVYSSKLVNVQPIIAVRVDSRMDVQRRRADKITIVGQATASI